ncbi:exported hypothetical protein [Stenotrophomonas maltophilia]|nr:exported hypothetical protein [Stenotrophomonas maltophilia]
MPAPEGPARLSCFPRSLTMALRLFRYQPSLLAAALLAPLAATAAGVPAPPQATPGLPPPPSRRAPSGPIASTSRVVRIPHRSASTHPTWRCASSPPMTASRSRQRGSHCSSAAMSRTTSGATPCPAASSRARPAPPSR